MNKDPIASYIDGRLGKDDGTAAGGMGFAHQYNESNRQRDTSDSPARHGASSSGGALLFTVIFFFALYFTYQYISRNSHAFLTQSWVVQVTSGASLGGRAPFALLLMGFGVVSILWMLAIRYEEEIWEFLYDPAIVAGSYFSAKYLHSVELGFVLLIAAACWRALPWLEAWGIYALNEEVLTINAKQKAFIKTSYVRRAGGAIYLGFVFSLFLTLSGKVPQASTISYGVALSVASIIALIGFIAAKEAAPWFARNVLPIIFILGAAYAFLLLASPPILVLNRYFDSLVPNSQMDAN